MLLFRLKKQTSKNVVDTTFKDKFSKMRHIFGKMLQIMVSLKNDNLVEESKKTEYCHCAVLFKEKSSFNNLAFSHNNSKQ